MNKLSKSTVVLIILTAAAIVLGVVLFMNMPESWTEVAGPGHWMEKGSFDHPMADLDKRGGDDYGRGFHGDSRGYGRGFGHGFPIGFLLIAGFVVFLVTRGRRHWGRKNHSRTILDQMYAEGKISVEEYKRKRAVIEEEN